ncbi:hypothetical protein O9929_26915 [Vibrio lentus]|nr:hypothetical protein [Vibrio lentus]
MKVLCVVRHIAPYIPLNDDELLLVTQNGMIHFVKVACLIYRLIQTPNLS